VLLVVHGCSSAAAVSVDSGISGRVVLAPTCPVQRVGQRCERGYQTTVAVYTAARHRLVRTFRSRPDGRFRVRLPPGRYILRGTHAGPPRSAPVTVTVHHHTFTTLTIAFDTGIR
jgi:hypothetical protein